MFTPRTLRVGDHVKINVDMVDREGTYAAGHEFTIIDIHFRGPDTLYDLRDHEVHVLGNVPFAYLTWVPPED